MANICANFLIIEGSKEEVARLCAFVATEDMVFDFEEIISTLYSAHSRLEDWGSILNAQNAGLFISADGTEAKFIFDSAWGVPLKVTKELSRSFPDVTVTHKYEEGSSNFSGYVIYKNGEAVETKDGDYNAYPVYEREDEEESE